MTKEELRPILVELAKHEGRVPWMYLDDARTPNVTVGIGCLVSNVDEAQRLPFLRIDGTKASREEVSADWWRVTSMRGGLQAKAYRGALYLDAASIDALASKRVKACSRQLLKLFPGFDRFPRPARLALLDLGFNCGVGQYPGLAGWVKLVAACNRVPPDWVTAAKEGATVNPDKKPSREARNLWRAACFLDASRI